jgi:excinuclease ABC subunit C
VDLVVLVRQMNFVCVNLALVRGGHFLGDRPVIFNTEQHFADSDELGDILETFLLQHYLEKAPEGMIVSNVGLTNSAAIELLAQEHQKKIKFKHKASGVLGTWLDQTQSNALAALTRQFGQNLLQQERLQAFVETLQLAIDKPLEQIRLECFDISHTSGEATTASCVAYFQLAMQPAAYRLYRIKADTQGDDYAAMDEVLRRRLLAAEAGTHPLPDVWLIDGGAGQVSTTMAVMRTFSHLPDLPIVIGVSKGEGRKAGLETLHVVATGESVVLGADSKALALAIEIRDEAHRFAITGMRKARDKQRKQSLLDEIEGIGPVRRKRLLTRFGGLAGLKNASVDELCTVQGVSLEVATRIYEALHG